MGRTIIAAPSSYRVDKGSPDLADTPLLKGNVQKEQQQGDKYQDRLFKYIPAEVVTLYLGCSAIVSSAGSAPHSLYWVIFAAGLVGTPLYLKYTQKVNSPAQLMISTVAFVVWIFALGGPFTEFAWYQQVYGAVLLPIFTFFVAIISPGLPPAPPQPQSAD